jgi:uncharacterized membrane protein YagU involved in acid resistance
MNALSGTPSAPSERWIAPILGGGILAGALDLIYACTYHGLVNGIPPVRILQSIGSGIFGRDSFQMGATSAAVGFAAHFFILIVAAALFYVVSRRFAFLRDRAYIAGMVFGVGIYCTMNYIVLPLSAAPHFKASTVGALSDLAMHVLVIGPAIALVIRYFDRRLAR